MLLIQSVMQRQTLPVANILWAARYNTGLFIELALKGVVFFLCFLDFQVMVPDLLTAMIMHRGKTTAQRCPACLLS